jgi:glycosyltransferase involved in cell wall biosynthesis
VRRLIWESLRRITGLIALPLLAVVASLPRRDRRSLVWGPVPLTNVKYWSAALRRAGWDSVTFVDEVYPMHRREDFDHYFEDLIPAGTHPLLRKLIEPYVACAWLLRRASVSHITFLGGTLWSTPYWRAEAWLYRRAGIRSVILPFGGDVLMYSRVADPMIRNALMTSYPDLGRKDRETADRVEFWCREADVIVMGFTADGVPRWDVPVGNMICIDLDEWRPRPREAVRAPGPVRVLHAPNHRGAKGTNYIVDAVAQLEAEGLEVELVLVENRPNAEIRSLMQEIDILADQLMLPGYGLAAIEGMASGLPVMANVEADPGQARLFRHRSFLSECPIVSTSPETVVERLRELVADAGLREEIGAASRVYVERYHSYEMAKYLFESIYSKVLDGKDVDLINLFDPKTSPYMRRVKGEEAVV